MQITHWKLILAAATDYFLSKWRRCIPVEIFSE